MLHSFGHFRQFFLNLFFIYNEAWNRTCWPPSISLSSFFYVVGYVVLLFINEEGWFAPTTVVTECMELLVWKNSPLMCLRKEGENMYNLAPYCEKRDR